MIKKEPVAVETMDKEVLQAFARVAKSEDGIIVLRHLMEMCGYKEPSMVMNPTTREIVPISSMWNESKRGVWLEFRKLLPRKQLNVIEMERA